MKRTVVQPATLYLPNTDTPRSPMQDVSRDAATGATEGQKVSIWREEKLLEGRLALDYWHVGRMRESCKVVKSSRQQADSGVQVKH
jgi:hypothetical protein